MTTRTEVSRRAPLPERRPHSVPGYVLTLRPVEIVRRVFRHVMTWALALRILALLFGIYGFVFLLIVKLIVS